MDKYYFTIKYLNIYVKIVNKKMFSKLEPTIIINEESKKMDNIPYQEMNSSSLLKAPNNRINNPIFEITKINETFPEDYKTRRFILLDTETTGFEINSDRLISINAVEMINGELTGIQFNSYLDKRFIYNSKPLLYYLSDYNYSRKDNIKKSLKTFLDFVKNDMIITHNANFDMKFINRELNKYGLEEIPLNRCICTLKYFRNLKKIGIIDKNFGLKLCDLCQYYGIYVEKKDLHQGIVDTIVFGRVVAKMFEDGIHNYNDIRNNFNEINDLGRSFINLHISDFNDGKQRGNSFDLSNHKNIINDNNRVDKVYRNNKREFFCKSEDKKRRKKININNFSFNGYKKNKNHNNNINNDYKNKQNNNYNKNNNHNNKINKDNKIRKNKNNIFNSMNSQYFEECANKNTPPKKIGIINKSKSHQINFDGDDMKLNFIKNAFKTYISSNKIK